MTIELSEENPVAYKKTKYMKCMYLFQSFISQTGPEHGCAESLLNSFLNVFYPISPTHVKATCLPSIKT